MRLTPEYRSVDLAAGAYETIYVSCTYVTILQLTGATTLQVGINNETPRTLVPQTLDFSKATPVYKVRLHNTGGGLVTALLQFADVPTLISQGDAAGGMAALIALITAGNVDLAALEVLVTAGNALLTAGNTNTGRITPATTLTPVNRTIIAQTGVGTTQILAANANRKWCCVTVDLDAVGRVYLGPTNAVAIATGSFWDGIAGGAWREHYTGAVWGTSDNGTERVRAYETT